MTDTERLSILKMIEAGRLTADEGIRLLDALDTSKREPGEKSGREPQRLRVVVTELGSGRRRAQASVPLSLVEVGLRLAARGVTGVVRIAGQPVDPATILDAVRSGTQGRILDIVDDQENIKAEVFLE
jgi:hypothetical protein